MACATMGVVNVTPDSFVGEVRTPGFEEAVDRCYQLVAEGAQLVDIGGESTRPGAEAVPVEEELDRVVPVIAEVAARVPTHVRLSVDTRSERVARAAVAAGAQIINDMSASLATIAGELGVGYVAAHMQGTPATMQNAPSYRHVIDEVLDPIVGAARLALDAGAAQVWIDPGIGFGKTLHHNLELIANIDRLVATGFPVLIGVSRKGMIGRMHAASDARSEFGTVEAVPTDDRLEASVAIASWCASLGVDVVRVHDVSETVQALKLVNAGRLFASESSTVLTSSAP